MTDSPFSAFRDAVHAGDVDAAVALFAPDAVFHSPSCTGPTSAGRRCTPS